MRYYLKDPGQQAITGPFELDEIDAKLKAGELPAGTLATRVIGAGLVRVQHAPPEDWVPAESIPGLGEEGPPSSIGLQPPPAPLPLPKAVNAPPSRPNGMIFCPTCGHKLAPDADNVCDRCGKKLVIVGQEPTRPLEFKPEPLLPKVAVGAATAAAGIGGCLSVVLLILGSILLFGFLLILNFMSKCKA